MTTEPGIPGQRPYVAELDRNQLPAANLDAGVVRVDELCKDEDVQARQSLRQDEGRANDDARMLSLRE